MSHRAHVTYVARKGSSSFRLFTLSVLFHYLSECDLLSKRNAQVQFNLLVVGVCKLLADELCIQ